MERKLDGNRLLGSWVGVVTLTILSSQRNASNRDATSVSELWTVVRTNYHVNILQM